MGNENNTAFRRTRIEALERHAGRLDRHAAILADRDGRFVLFRLASLAVGGLLTWAAFAFGPAWLGRITGLAALGVFIAVIAAHRRLDRVRARFELARRWNRSQIARLQLDWDHIPLPPGGLQEISPEHPFAADLNLVGPRSLHHLIDISISRGGSARLLSWLLNPVPDPEVIEARQALLKEILPLNGFRSRAVLQGGLVARNPEERWNGEALVAWLEKEKGYGTAVRTLALLGLLSAANILLFGLNVFGLLPAYWVATLIVYSAIYLTQFRKFEDLFGEAQHLSVSLDRFRAILVFLERYPYPAGSRLAKLAEPFWTAARRPSDYLRTAALIASAASLQNNTFLWLPLNAALPWDLFFAFQLHRYKGELRQLLPAWLDTWYELESLNSLANYAYLNPGYAFPKIVPEGLGEGVFIARGMGHPLLPGDTRVVNDFQLDRLGEVVIITGSNMSGKSTFLRTIGANLVLAFSGAPVCAEMLVTIPYRLFSSLNVTDSLSDGISYFYAEVRRLKALLEALRRASSQQQFPVFFLIDEIFRGTNNRERAIGSRAYVGALAGGNGVGVISTHDLDLVHLEKEIPQIENYHFKEEVKNGRMVFDYRLRPGPCPTTNALRIMQLAGLPVGESE